MQRDSSITRRGRTSTDVSRDSLVRSVHNSPSNSPLMPSAVEEKQKANKADAANGHDESDESSSSDETEDEEGFLATAELDAQLNATLEAIKKKDPRVYDGTTTFYSPVEEAEAGADAAAAASKQKKEKPVTIQDYHRQRYLEGDTGKDFDKAEEVDAAQPKSYVQEQADIKQSIRDEIAKFGEDLSEDSDDDFIKAKSKPQRPVADVEATDTTDVHPSRAKRVKTPAVPKPDVTMADKDPELFLSNFMASRAWVENEGPGWEAFESDDGDDAGDDGADKWEEAYNLRFEDPSKSNEVLKTYARDVTAARSVRREEKSTRKRLREQEAEKKALEKQQRKEERARLRRLKIEEAENKLNKIRKAAGLSGNALRDEDWQKLLDAGFDNDKWEEEMAKHFNDQYYAQADQEMDDAQSEAASDDEDEDKKESKSKKSKKPKKPTWDDDIDIKDLIPDFDDETEAALATGAQNDSDEGEGEEEENGPSAKRQKTTKDRKKERLQSQKEARRERAKLEAIVDAHLTIEEPELLASGASKSSSSAEPKASSGFRYRETKPESFGLTTLDILMASDGALNQYAGLKKLAHFRPEDKQAKDKKLLGKKARLRQWRKDTFGAEFEREPPAFNPGRPEPVLEREEEKAAAEGTTGKSNIIEGGSKKKRKRTKSKKTEETAV